MTLDQAISLIVITPLIAFWAWMFVDMVNDETIPPAAKYPYAFPPEGKVGWTLIFIVLNIFGAGVYYFAHYKKK